MTTEGWWFIALALCIGFGAINTGTNLLYLVLSVMLSVLLVSGALALINLRGLKINRTYPREFHAGESLQALIEIQNHKRRICTYSVGVVDKISAPGHLRPEDRLPPLAGYCMAVPPQGQSRCAVEFSLPWRGVYTLEEARIVSRYPFGFIERTRRIPGGPPLLVYPPLLPPTRILPQLSRMLGEQESETRGPGTGIYGIRDYYAGDPARHIHWKHSAKGLGIKTKEFEEEQSLSYRLMLDLRCPRQPSAALIADFERAVSLAATVAKLLLDQSHSVGLWTTMGNVPIALGQSHLRRLMRTLAEVVPQAPDAPVAAPDKATQTVAEIWIDYHRPGDITARPEMVIPRSPRSQVIDARNLGDEPAPVQPYHPHQKPHARRGWARP